MLGRRIEWSYWNSFGDDYRGWARDATGGLDFFDGDGAPVTAWRWTATGYTVTNTGRAPVDFVRAGK